MRKLKGQLGLILVLALLMLLVGQAVVFAAPPGGPADQTPTLVSTLTGMAVSAVGVGAVIAFLFEKFKWFQALSPNGRSGVIIGLAIGLPLIARLLTQFVPDYIWEAAEPYWQTIVAGFLVWTSSQAFHKIDTAATDIRAIRNGDG